MLTKSIYRKNLSYNTKYRDETSISSKTVGIKNIFFDTMIIGILIIGSKVLNIPTLIIALLFYLVCRIILNDSKYTFAYLMILVPNLGVIFIPGVPVPVINILIPIAIFKMVLSNGIEKFNEKLAVMTFSLIFYEFLHAFLYNVKELMSLASWVFTIIYVFLFMSSKKSSYNHELTIQYFISGICISSIYGLYMNFANRGLLYNFSQIDVTDRFAGAAGDPNYYSMYILVGLFSLLILLGNRTKIFPKFIYGSLFILLPLLALMSLSRMFIIVFGLVGIIYLSRILFSINKYSKHKKAIFKIIPICIALFFMFPNRIMDNIKLIFSRFTMYKGDLNLLTSNRNLIAEYIIDFLVSNPFYMLFGVGIQNYGQRIGYGIGYAHNIILELLASGGFIGTILFVLYIINLIVIENKNCKIKYEKKNGLIGWLPLVAMMIGYMSINAIEVESFYILLLFAIKNIWQPVTN